MMMMMMMMMMMTVILIMMVIRVVPNEFCITQEMSQNRDPRQGSFQIAFQACCLY
jgi:cytochrome oxidase Cu insertion factor (SCO1/SenC/PrrC family)